MKQCKTKKCTNEVKARGYCNTCYYKHLRQNDFESGSPTGKWKHRLSNIDTKKQIATCSSCGEVKVHPRNKKRTQWRCAKEANHRSKLYKRVYRETKKEQLKNSCEICNSKEKLCWDHNHETGEFRGTLCSKCNIGLGCFQDNETFLKKAIKYLKNDNTN